MTISQTIFRSQTILRLCCICSAVCSAACFSETLFNGKDLSGWDSWVTMQPPTNEFKYKPEQVRGLNHDVKKVFTVVNGALRVSGEEWGALISQQEYENFHLSFEIKWGDKKWFPREAVKRDSGVLYFSNGAYGGQGGHWMRSHEFQIQEGDCGDYHSIDGVLVDAPVTDANEGDWKFYRYDPKAAARKNLHARILKLGDYEKPNNEWNLMEVIADGKNIIHKVNGKVVLRMTHSQQMIDGKMVPLTHGKIQIQSEGAEVFYRNIKVETLTKPAVNY